MLPSAQKHCCRACRVGQSTDSSTDPVPEVNAVAAEVDLAGGGGQAGQGAEGEGGVDSDEGDASESQVDGMTFLASRARMQEEKKAEEGVEREDGEE
eukprot:405782-Pleurochrysis_carterae.AAC.1